jgi:hypothetical protein
VALLRAVPMFGQASGADFSVQTAAARSASCPHVAAGRDDLVAAVTGEKPMRMPAPAFVRERDPNQTAIAQARHVDPDLHS